MRERIRVAFDQRIFVYQRHGGMCRYYAGLADHLPDHGVDPTILAPFYITDRLRELPRGMVWGRHFSPTPRKQRAAMVLGELALGGLARAAGADIVHETFYSHRRRAPRRCRIVTTVHDMIPELFPQFFPGDITPQTKASSITRADHIICDSESSKRDLLALHPGVADKISVVLLGFDAGFGHAATAVPFRRAPYVLFVGGRGGWKNFGGLLTAFARSRLPGEGIDLVCIGGGEFTPDETGLMSALGLAGKVERRDASDIELANWYRHALLFAFPSLYEGFGIPPLEAMASGCPVVAGHASSLPEVCGDAAEWAEPESVDSLVVALENVAFSDARRQELEGAGREQVKRFSWDRCARETADVYRMLA